MVYLPEITKKIIAKDDEFIQDQKRSQKYSTTEPYNIVPGILRVSLQLRKIWTKISVFIPGYQILVRMSPDGWSARTPQSLNTV